MSIEKNHNFKERIAKKMARAGLCSRREAERWIQDGRVTLNGVILDSPAIKVSTDDKILLDNIPIPASPPPRIWRFHKPKGCLVTQNDPKGRMTIFQILPKDLPRTISIGRLDYDSEGLLLLTNDGEIARKLELPSNGWLRLQQLNLGYMINLDTLKSN